MTPYNYLLLFFSVLGGNVCECLQNVLVTLPKLHIENSIRLGTGRIPEFPEKQGSRLRQNEAIERCALFCFLEANVLYSG